MDQNLLQILEVKEKDMEQNLLQHDKMYNA